MQPSPCCAVTIPTAAVPAAAPAAPTASVVVAATAAAPLLPLPLPPQIWRVITNRVVTRGERAAAASQGAQAAGNELDRRYNILLSRFRETQKVPPKRGVPDEWTRGPFAALWALAYHCAPILPLMHTHPPTAHRPFLLQ